MNDEYENIKLLRQKNNKKTAVDRGKRLKLTRQLLSLTRKKMQDTYGINANTLQSWEKGINCFNEETAKKLIKIFQKEGAEIKENWLLHGEQKIITSLTDTKIAPLDNNLIFEKDIKIIDEISFFRQNNKNSIISMITDDTLYPIYKIGDYVGGITINTSKNLKDLIGEFCIIHTKKNELFIKKIVKHHENNIFTISGINYFSKLKEPHYFSCEIHEAAKITRHWLTSDGIIE